MNASPILPIAAILLGMGSGLLLGRLGYVEPPTETPATQTGGPSGTTEANEDHPRGKAHVSGGPAPKHNLRAILRFRQTPGALSPELLRDAERRSTADLKAGILAMLPEPDGMRPEAENMARRRVFETFTDELFRRGGVEALEWAAALERPEARQPCLSMLIRKLAEQDPKLALTWMDRFRDEFGKDQTATFAISAVAGATGRSARELLELVELYGDRMLHVGFPGGVFAEDFDFRMFVTSIPVSSQGSLQLGPTISKWASTDREAALATIKELAAKGPASAKKYYISALVSGILPAEGEEGAARWMAGKLDELPAGTRAIAVEALHASANLRNPEMLAAVCRALQTDDDRVVLVAGALTGSSGDGAEALKLLDSEVNQVEALKRAASGRNGTTLPPDRTIHFEQIMEQAELSPQARDQVRAAWGPPQN